MGCAIAYVFDKFIGKGTGQRRFRNKTTTRLRLVWRRTLHPTTGCL
jgi:hypothetical protein